MGLFDGYFDPQQFGEGGGLLGRLLALQQQQGQYQPGAAFDEVPPVPQRPVLQPMPLPNLPGYGPSSGSSTVAANLMSQYQALRPVLGDYNAMLATINPDIGKSLMAQALARQQKSDNSSDVVSAGCGCGASQEPTSGADDCKCHD
jgi:hypothetical protein